MTTELSTVQPAPPVSVGNMLQSLIESGITESNVGALERMMDLYERNEARMAEQAFAQAFVALQEETPQIEAVKEVPDNNGNVRYKFAPYDYIMKKVQPLLTKHGFTVSFDTRTDSEGKRLTAICCLTHKAGHSRKNEFAVAVSAPPRATPTQADGAAKTYAKRGALSDALNIVTTVDTDGLDDARMLGVPISDAEAERLRSRVKSLRFDETAFLDWLGVDSFHHVPSSRLEEAHAFLDETDRKNQGKK